MSAEDNWFSSSKACHVWRGDARLCWAPIKWSIWDKTAFRSQNRCTKFVFSLFLSLSLSYTNTYTAMFSSLVLCMLFTFVVNYLGELDERMAELEESRRKLVNLRMQKEGSSALHVPVSMSNGSSMSDKLTEKNIGLRELKDSIEEAKVGRKFTHFHFPYSILLLLSVGLFISVSFNELCRHWQLLVFQNCRRQRMQIWFCWRGCRVFRFI